MAPVGYNTSRPPAQIIAAIVHLLTVILSEVLSSGELRVVTGQKTEK
jgi:hypothetical protein